MKVQITLFLAVFISILAKSQSQGPYPPKWQYGSVSFKASKMRITSNDGKKIIFDDYKASEVWITGADNVDAEVNVDIPDKFAIFNATITKINYEYGNGLQTIAYTATKDNKMVAVHFTYNISKEEVTHIVVVAIDNYVTNPTKTMNFTLYELRDQIGN